MIEYVVEHNPDDRVLTKASQILRNGGLLCFPTETNWVVVCDPFQKQSVDKLYRLRHVENTKHFTVLCADFRKAMEIAFIDDGAFSLLKRVIPGPYTFIFTAQKKITKLLKASKVDHQVGIRFPPSKLCQKILEVYGDVVLSTHLTPDMLELDPEIEDGLNSIYSALIEDHFGQMIDLIIDPGEYEFLGHTTIVDFTTGGPEVIREGIGNPSLFQS
jgi:tRNA threonylcarbamoyl adenosine modification protein (Sua5/YciO/YrdC/YwlC family)